MAKQFDDLMREMDEACEFLRCFTLGKPGFTQRDGVAGISRVEDLCERLQKRFPSGEHEKEASNAVTSARNQILAAKARLAILRR